MSQELGGTQSVGQSSKRTTREHSVNSPPSKKTSSKTPASVDDCLQDLTQIIKDHRQLKAATSKQGEQQAAEMAQVL
jgi:DNA-binding ferritin-like protein